MLRLVQHPFSLVYFSGDLHVHWRYGIWTHGQVSGWGSYFPAQVLHNVTPLDEQSIRHQHLSALLLVSGSISTLVSGAGM